MQNVVEYQVPVELRLGIKHLLESASLIPTVGRKRTEYATQNKRSQKTGIFVHFSTACHFPSIKRSKSNLILKSLVVFRSNTMNSK